MRAGKLATSVRVTDEGGRHVVIDAGDDVPAWAPAEGEPSAAAYETALRALFPA